MGTFDSNRAGLSTLYNDQSLMTFEGEQFQGGPTIWQKLSSLPFAQVRHNIIRVDCQPNPVNNGIVVFVIGDMQTDQNPTPLKYGQVFQLVQPSPGVWQIANDMFRLNP